MFAPVPLGQALKRSACDLTKPRLLWHALWPSLLAFFIWSLIAWFAWAPTAQWFAAEMPDWSWLEWAGPYLAHIAVFFLFAPLVYLTALMLLAVFALPRMMLIIAARDYPHLERRATAVDALWGSIGNTLAAGAVFTVGWLITLPLLLIPGAIFFQPLLWSAWLNQRTFRFDALAEHATATERKQLIVAQRGNLYAAGLTSALVVQVPVLNLLAPAFAALLFVHLCLEALDRQRGATSS